MNRPIKFRVWDHILSEWIKSDQLVLRPNGSVTDGSILIDSKYIQFNTGLTDSNDDPIYEGDIIIDNQKQKYEIIFDENHARYDLKVCGENKLRGQTSYGTEIYEKKHIEVIGNIFENPELLKTI